MKYLILLLFISMSFGNTNMILDGRGSGNKTITIVNITDTTGNSGELQIMKEKLDDCLWKIPDIKNIEGIYTAKPMFAKGINDDGRDGVGPKGWIKLYTATVKVPYVIVQRYLILVAVKSPIPKDPIFKEINKRFRHVETFTSVQGNGDHFAGRSKRFYYFSTKEQAIEDAKKQARVWLKEQSVVMCKE